MYKPGIEHKTTSASHICLILILPGLRAHLQRPWWNPLHQWRQHQLLSLWKESKCAEIQQQNNLMHLWMSSLLTCGLCCVGRAGSPDRAHYRLSAARGSFGGRRRGGQASIDRVFILKVLIWKRGRKGRWTQQESIGWVQESHLCELPVGTKTSAIVQRHINTLRGWWFTTHLLVSERIHHQSLISYPATVMSERWALVSSVLLHPAPGNHSPSHRSANKPKNTVS